MFTKGLFLMKKLFAAFLAVLMLVTLASCKKDETSYALTIEGTDISSEIYTYFLDRVMSRPQDFGLKDKASKKELNDAATEQCKRYIYANTRFADMGLTLSVAKKTEISQHVNNIWIRFENHYKSIGVSKQTITKICTADAYSDVIFTELYDKGTENAASEEKIKTYFYENYTAFNTVCVYFNSSDGVTPMTQLEISELITRFDTLAAESTGTSAGFSDAVKAFGYAPSGTVILKKDSDGYPKGFFDKVYSQTDNSVQIIRYDDCVFAVFKENLKEKGDSVYANYRMVCINELYSEENNAEIKKNISGFKVEKNEEIIDEIYLKLK